MSVDPAPGVRDREARRRIALEADQLPGRGQTVRKLVWPSVVDQECEQFLVEPAGEFVLLVAPLGGEPVRRDQAQHGLAAGGGGLERAPPALAGGDPVLRVEIEKDIVGSAPAFAHQPIPQRQRPFVVVARMADEQSRQGVGASTVADSDKIGSHHVDPAGSDRIRPPHIHFEVQGKFDRLITQMYFPGEPLNASDPLLLSANNPELLVARPLESPDSSNRSFVFDIVLIRG
jgi:hypothetical protein